MEPNFSGYVTKANLKCADGRVIMAGAFKHQDKTRVPVVYQHNHNDVNQVLGHAILSEREDGTWGDVYLNDTPSAQNAAKLVAHGDIDKFSIWAKNLIERGEFVHSGDIQEVSLVLAGANPGASIYNVLMHGNVDQDDLLIVGGEINHADTDVQEKPVETTDEPKDDDESGKTVAEVLETLDEEQKLAVNAFIDDVVKEAVVEALTEEPNIEHDNLSSKKGTKMSRNAFDGSNTGTKELPQLKHSDVASILAVAKGPNGEGGDGATASLRSLIRSPQGKELMHAGDYGIDNMEVMFPDAQAIMARPTFVDRRQDWVKKFLAGTSHSPFSRVKTMHADITADEARAKGYIKANEKTEEVFPVFKRTTGPTWIYKKQKLDRQDIIDVTDFDVVAWMKAEMRGKLDEEVARAALFGDGRPNMIGGELNPDKIKDPGGANTSGDGIRAIINDNALYTGVFEVGMPESPSGTDWNLLLDTVTEAGEFYLGSGHKTAFMPYRIATKLLTIRDEFGHRVYRNLSEVAGDMDVAEICKVPTELFPPNCLCVVLDLSDYNFGTNKGGEITLFDDFDIDFNQYKYLIETYLSGALVVPYSAQVFFSVESTLFEVTPIEPAFDENLIEIPVQAGVTYKVTAVTGDNTPSILNTTRSPGSDLLLDADNYVTVTITAEAKNGYVIPDEAEYVFVYEYDPEA